MHVAKLYYLTNRDNLYLLKQVIYHYSTAQRPACRGIEGLVYQPATFALYICIQDPGSISTTTTQCL